MPRKRNEASPSGEGEAEQGVPADVSWCVVAVCLLVGIVSTAFGCTFLATFDEPPPKEAQDGGRDSGQGLTCEGFTPDPNARPCSVNIGRGTETYCGCDRLANYQGSPDDLVVCDGEGEIAEVSRCSSGCAFYPPGTPDACDSCAGKADGRWCATELGVDAVRVIMTCQAGRQVQTSAVDCPTRCTGSGPAASCN